MENYTPKVYQEGFGTIYVEMLLHADKCPLCKKIMIKKVKEHLPGGVFPGYKWLSQEEQAKNADINFKSNTKVNDNYICEKCEKEGKAVFLCAMCNEAKSTDKIQVSIGDAPEFLCKDCYNTIPAKNWEEKITQLDEKHKYDNQ